MKTLGMTESMATIMTQAFEIQRMIAKLNQNLESFSEQLHLTETPPEPLNHEEIQRLLRLNQHLTKLEAFLSETGLSLNAAMTQKVATVDDPMSDYEIEAVLHYTLREEDAESHDDSDNFITTRKHDLKHDSELSEQGDWRKDLPGLEPLNTEAHCWLFYDLYDHCYGTGMRNLPLRDCLRIGEVWVDVVIRQQYWFNLDTGTWTKK